MAARVLLRVVLGCVVMGTAGVTANARQSSDADRAAIVQSLLGYADGFLGGSPERMARAVSPYVSKRQLVNRPNTKPFLSQMNADTLIDSSHGVKIPAEERRIRTEVLHVAGDAASASVFTSRFNDYVHLVKRGGQWQIVNVLWHGPTAAAEQDAAKPAVDRAARQFIGALIARDRAAMTGVIHDLAHLRTFGPGPQGRPRFIRELNAETLLTLLGAGQSPLASGAADPELVVEGIDGDIASARATAGGTTVFMHLSRHEDGWRITNVLIYPPAPQG